MHENGDDEWASPRVDGTNGDDPGPPDGEIGLSGDPEAFLQSFVDDQHAYLSWLNVDVDAVEYGRVVMTVPYDGKLRNGPSPAMHGGVAATLLDTVGGIALRTTLDDPLDGGVATANLTVNYLERATDDLTAVGEVVRAGDTLGVSAVTAYGPDEDGEHDPVATGQGSYRLFR